MKQEIAHIKAFAEQMTDDNWQDMRLHILRQVDELSRLTASPLPNDRVQEAAKLLRDRLPAVITFYGAAGSFMLGGLEDLARDVLALAAPASPLPKEIAGLIERLRDPHLMSPETTRFAAAAALEQMARDRDHWREARRNAMTGGEMLQTRIRELEATLQSETGKKLVANLKVIELEAEREQIAQENERLGEIVKARDQQLTNEIALTQKFAGQHDEGIARIRELEAERDCLKDNLVFADERNRELLGIRAKTIKDCIESVKTHGYGRAIVQPIIDRLRALDQSPGIQTEGGNP